MRPKRSAQLEMFSDLASPHGINREHPRTYAAICHLRQHGYRVFRVSPTQHNVAGHLLDGHHVRALAKKLGWE